jgi:uncharacterized membrane protein YidH (DUF202 family)
MRGTVLVGVVLAVLGIAALAFGQFRYTETEPVLKVGPVEINKKETHTVSIPTVGGVLLLIAGIGLVVVGRKRS